MANLLRIPVLQPACHLPQRYLLGDFLLLVTHHIAMSRSLIQLPDSDTSKLRHQCIILPSLPAPFHRTKTTPTTLTNSISPRGSFPSKIKLPARLAGLSSLLPLRAAPHPRERLCIPPGLGPASPERCCHLVPRHHRTVPTGCESPARPRVQLHRTLGAGSRGAGTPPAHSAGAGSVPALLAAARVCRTLSAVSSCCSYCGMMVKRGEPLNPPGAYSPNG